MELCNDDRYKAARVQNGWLDTAVLPPPQPPPKPLIYDIETDTYVHELLPKPKPSFEFTFSINAFTFVDPIYSLKQADYKYALDKQAQNLLKQPDIFPKRTPDTSDDDEAMTSSCPSKCITSTTAHTQTNTMTEGLNTSGVSYLPFPLHE